MRRSDTSIKTERLWLGQIDETDAEAIVSLRADKEVYRYFLNPVKISAADHKKWYEEQYKDDRNRIDWVAVGDYSGDFIGVYGAKKVDENTVEVSYITKPDKQGYGYAKEALESIIEWCMENWDFSILIAEVHHDNKSSIEFIKKPGFYECGYRDAF